MKVILVILNWLFDYPIYYSINYLFLTKVPNEEESMISIVVMNHN